MSSPEFSLQGPGLSVRFIWTQDRYSHEIVTASGKLISVEGDSTQAWPASSPIQHLAEHHCGDSLVLLGLGSAGTGHWSLSVTLEITPSVAGLLFEYACRSQATPLQLGNTYRSIGIRPQVTLIAGSVAQELSSGMNYFRPCHLVAPGTTQWSYRIHVKIADVT
jgi:hypothetical protein